jgi:5-methylcytosine-specific restriction enzyme subunit McrC
MTTTSVLLDELDTQGRLVTLTDAVATVLDQTGLVEVRPHGLDVWRLLPQGRVGAVRIGDFQVEVQPKGKLGLTHLLFLLGYTADPGFRPDLVVGQRDAQLWPALGYSLAQSIEKALERGVLQGYRTTDEALRTIRGRIRFGDQISARPGLLMPIEVTHDDFTVDTAENRVLLAALNVMLGVPRLDAGVRRRLLHLVGRLEGVSLLPRGASIPTWHPSRLNARYHGALRLAEIVLRNAAAKPGADGIEVASFVVTMWEVFENFVTVALTEALRKAPGRTQAQLAAYLAGEHDDWRHGTVPMKVDVVHLDAVGRPQVVFDAKYKLAPSERYGSADFYQMLAYSTALDVPRAWLVYAGGIGEQQHVYRVKNTGVEIVTYPLDLSATPRDILTRISALAHAATAPFAGIAADRFKTTDSS